MAETNPNTQPANAPQNNQGGNAPQKSGNTPAYTQEQLDAIVSAREQRASTAALKSFFEQQGMPEDEIKQAISTYKENRKKNEPDINALTAQNEQYKQAAINAHIESKATIEALKLGVDINTVPYVLKLSDFSAVTDEKGNINADKLKEALSKVLTDVPQFKKAEDHAATGFRKIGSDGGNKNEDETNAIRKAFGLKPKT